ncbi:hypothetical protein DCO48_18120 [Pseudomonas sp. SDI]|uniref:hypothetical protein n=1 Tax=Pseudomonas sp. SDI TaxID=2170734 RepID=UPI000DE605BD|nr:hypothetical protein [Pseudomonas sp. SDI]PWB31086.1 hypothetical protein DCO48_18120 [Pseudomonas sp. SDI]
MISLAFPILVSASVSSAYWLKWKISGKNLNFIKFFICVIYNSFFIALYRDIMKTDCFLFFGCLPGLVDEHISIGWVSFACTVIHAFALPMTWKMRWWFTKKQPENSEHHTL